MRCCDFAKQRDSRTSDRVDIWNWNAIPLRKRMTREFEGAGLMSDGLESTRDDEVVEEGKTISILGNLGFDVS